MNALADTARLLAPCLYVLQKMGKISKHHLSKVLYVADKFHIAKYGRSLTGDVYIAMNNGPVPSMIYDFIKLVEGKTDGAYIAKYAKYIPEFIGFRPPHEVFAKKDPDLDFLSKSAIDALNEGIATVGPMSFGQRTDFTHDSAWKSTPRNQKISIVDMARAAGANDAMVEYIKATM